MVDAVSPSTVGGRREGGIFHQGRRKPFYASTSKLLFKKFLNHNVYFSALTGTLNHIWEADPIVRHNRCDWMVPNCSSVEVDCPSPPINKVSAVIKGIVIDSVT